jgi:hypothetical protein
MKYKKSTTAGICEILLFFSGGMSSYKCFSLRQTRYRKAYLASRSDANEEADPIAVVEEELAGEQLVE